MSNQFTEKETESYYDAEDAIYRTVWDEDGSVHWGLFDESTGQDFLAACANLDHMMAEKGRIDSDSRVLDLGCGNGATAIALSARQGCQVTGIDLSGVRIGNAQKARESQSLQAQQNLTFQKASATALPFPDGSFTHVWSQAVIYHVPYKRTVLKEVHRVLAAGGIMVFDDLIKPQSVISPEGQKYVYERLLYDTEFTFESYQESLVAQGFRVLEAHDLSQHLKTSYLVLADRTPKGSSEHAEHYEYLTKAYLETAAAVDRQEMGWGFFVCQK